MLDQNLTFAELKIGRQETLTLENLWSFSKRLKILEVTCFKKYVEHYLALSFSSVRTSIFFPMNRNTIIVIVSYNMFSKSLHTSKNLHTNMQVWGKKLCLVPTSIEMSRLSKWKLQNNLPFSELICIFFIFNEVPTYF